MKWLIYIFVFFTWAFALAGVLFWLFGSMFNDAPATAQAAQVIFNQWLNGLVVAIVVTIAVVLLKDPKWRAAASFVGLIVCFVLFIRPFQRIQTIGTENRQRANSQNKALLDETRKKLLSPEVRQLSSEELAQTIKTLHALEDSQGEEALNVLRVAIKGGVVPVSGVIKDKEVLYPKAGKKRGDVPVLNQLVYQKASILQVYLEAGANPNVADTAFGLTPLMTAAGLEPTADALAKVKLLLRHKADPKTRDQMGKTALDHAQSEKEIQAGFLSEIKGTDSYANKRRGENEAKLKISDEMIALLSR